MKKHESIMKKKLIFNKKANEPSNCNGCKENSFLEIQYVYLSRFMVDGFLAIFNEYGKKKEA